MFCDIRLSASTNTFDLTRRALWGREKSSFLIPVCASSLRDRLAISTGTSVSLTVESKQRTSQSVDRGTHLLLVSRNGIVERRRIFVMPRKECHFGTASDSTRIASRLVAKLHRIPEQGRTFADRKSVWVFAIDCLASDHITQPNICHVQDAVGVWVFASDVHGMNDLSPHPGDYEDPYSTSLTLGSRSRGRGRGRRYSRQLARRTKLFGG